MNPSAFEIAQAVLVSLGGGALIVFGLSSFLGKTWAQRILQSEKAELDKDIASYKKDLDSLAQAKSLNYQQKIDLYKLVANPMIELVSLLSKENGLTNEHVQEFDRQRLYITAQLALFAPQNVFKTFNDLIDYIYDSIETQNYDFGVFRIKALDFFSEMRKDIGIYKDNVSYEGTR
ncbi:hypothetical protein [Rheinheimera fenheensis]|uniref:hypothetical protein n=1 Tax=Rheinheimera fenheensis TaxID=3152295 RepID=UPI00325F01B9